MIWGVPCVWAVKIPQIQISSPICGVLPFLKDGAVGHWVIWYKCLSVFFLALWRKRVLRSRCVRKHKCNLSETMNMFIRFCMGSQSLWGIPWGWYPLEVPLLWVVTLRSGIEDSCLWDKGCSTVWGQMFKITNQSLINLLNKLSSGDKLNKPSLLVELPSES